MGCRAAIPEAVRARGESELVKEAAALEKSVGAPGERRGPFEVMRLP